MLSSVIAAGNSFAISMASSSLSLSRFIGEQLGGISQLRFLDKLVKEDRIDKTADAINQIHSTIVNRNGCVVSITADNPEEVMPMVRSFLLKLLKRPPTLQCHPANSTTEVKGIEINSAVNFVAQAWKLPKWRHTIQACSSLCPEISPLVISGIK